MTAPTRRPSASPREEGGVPVAPPADRCLYDAPLADAVLADDLRALAEYGGLDAPTVDVLRQAAARLDVPPTPEPGYERIAEAIVRALDVAGIEVTARDREWGAEVSLTRVARVLDKAGLIDWAAFAEDPSG